MTASEHSVDRFYQRILHVLPCACEIERAKIKECIEQCTIVLDKHCYKVPLIGFPNYRVIVVDNVVVTIVGDTEELNRLAHK